MTFGIVYGLYDPRDGNLRYVGQTTTSVGKRFSQYFSESWLQRSKSYCRNWVKSLLELGLRPEIRVLGEAESRESLDCLEIETIAKFRAKGLTNIESGGRSASGYHLGEEFSQKISQIMKGNTRNLGHKASKLTRLKLSKSHSGLLVGPKHPGYLHDISTELILSRLKSGVSRSELALELGITPKLISRRLSQAERAGLSEIPKSTRARKVPTEAILKRVAEGKTWKEVAETLHISVPLVALRLRQWRATHG